jgi:hypothetical protein
MNQRRRLGRMHAGVVRILSVLVGFAGLGYSVLTVSPAGAASVKTSLGLESPPWLSIVTVIALLGLPLALACVVLVVSPEWVQRIAGGTAIVQLAVVGTWLLPVALGAEVPRISEAWVLILCLVPTALAAIAWRETVVAVVVVVAFLLLTSLRVEALGPREFALGGLPASILNTMLVLLVSVVVAAFILVTRRLAAARDTAAVVEAGEFVNDAREQAWLREKVRFDALMHDRILATLLLAHRDRVSARAQIALEARNTLEQLDVLASRGPGTPMADEAMSARDFVNQQREIALDAHSSIVFTFETDGDVSVPAEVAQAMGEASVEALRNSIRHAGVPFRTVERAMHARVTSERVEVFILDNGCGFELELVPQARMGVAVSIIDRMHGMAGGEVDVRSGVGVGTIVTLRWYRP